MPSVCSVVTGSVSSAVALTGRVRGLFQKSLSTEELSAEMANLEGLMKDLNAITQQEFEC